MAFMFNKEILIITVTVFSFCCTTEPSHQNSDNTLGSPKKSSPFHFARLAGGSLVEHPLFFLYWGYGGAVAIDGLQQASEVFNLNFAKELDKYLNLYETDSTQIGYKILNNLNLSFDDSVGDRIGLFPIVYLNRAVMHSRVNSRYDNKTDLQIAKETAEKYIIKYPRTLSDGTFSRNIGWKGAKHGENSFVWADDQFMGLTLLCRLGKTLGYENYVEFASKEILTFANHLFDHKNGGVFHGYDGASGRHSCCKWGRANGWTLMAYVEVLTAMSKFVHLRQSAVFSQVRTNFHVLSQYVATHQSSSGLWHQVINETWTYLETSSSAMFLSSIIQGVINRWLPSKSYLDVIYKGWSGLQKTLLKDGQIRGICMGTDILNSAEDYNSRPTPYLLSGDGGVGAVLYSAVQMQKFINFIQFNQ